MIQIRIGRDSLVISGHAGAGAKGGDVVCAAVSTLVTGAAEFWKDNENVLIHKEEDGENICFKFKFNNFFKKNDIQCIYGFVVKCLEMIAAQYPSYVSIAHF